MHNILITGANSYIGTQVESYLLQWPDDYCVTTLDVTDSSWISTDFVSFDTVFNVAGIAHIKETKDNRHLYYDVNRDLAVSIAKKAKASGVKQYILLSSMAVYGLIEGHITKKTSVNPQNAYGESKAQADEIISKLEDDSFKFACLRPPMVYGKDCKGNYQSLRKFALSSSIFPKIDNRRSMIYIGNLCEFVKECIDEERSGVFFPQNGEYINTGNMVAEIARQHGKKISLVKIFNPLIKSMPSATVKKVFGSLTYEKTDVVSRYGLEESIRLTES